MTYSTDMPPTVRRTNQTAGGNPDDWVLETNSGTQIATYTRAGMELFVWWEDCVDYIASDASSTNMAVKDITLLLAERSWSVEA